MPIDWDSPTRVISVAKLEALRDKYYEEYSDFDGDSDDRLFAYGKYAVLKDIIDRMIPLW